MKQSRLGWAREKLAKLTPEERKAAAKVFVRTKRIKDKAKELAEA